MWRRNDFSDKFVFDREKPSPEEEETYTWSVEPSRPYSPAEFSLRLALEGSGGETSDGYIGSRVKGDPHGPAAHASARCRESARRHRHSDDIGSDGEADGDAE